MNQNQKIRVIVLQLAVIAGVCAFLFFFGLGSFGLVGADEPRYAQIGREMLARRDLVTPTINGQPWLEKPVLLYWREMEAYSIFGVYDWAARLPSAVYATALVFIIFFFMRRFRPGAEMDAALITASSAAVIGFARGASTDMQLAAPLCVAMLAWWTWHETGRRLWLIAFFVLLGLGALAKGPVAPALALMMVAAYALAQRDKAALLRSFWWPGLLLFFAVVLPWYVAVQIKVPQFFRVFFVQHNLERFGTNLYQHSQPFWYYLPVFLLATVPWTVFALMAVVDAGKALVRRFRAVSMTGHVDDRFRLFLLCWIVVPIVFFSLSRSKLPGYILPSIPAVALLTADYLRRSARLPARWAMMLHSLLCGLLVGAALLVPWIILKARPNESARIAIAIGTGATAILVLLIVRRAGVRLLHFATLVPVIVSLAFVLRAPTSKWIDEADSARTVDARLQNLNVPPIPIFVFNVKRDVEYGLNFYRNQPIGRYERDGIPAQMHLVIVKQGSENDLRARVGSRQISRLGDFPPQHLEFFLVSNP
jgi:4-amino-4-deoxy-L-arabinose transferase-like glycosyltransferase